MAVLPVILDMETQDPDDALTLCLLATHPDVRLHAISVNPGTRAQLGVVRSIRDRRRYWLRRLDRADIPIGARDPASSAKDVSPFHHAWLGDTPSEEPDGTAVDVLAAAIAREPSSTLLCGAPLHNVRALLETRPDIVVERWVVQGGFAGDNVVPPEHRLPKFAGKTMTESHNFGANKKATLAVLASDRIREKRIVGKNVTHGVVWDADLQTRVVMHAPKSRGVEAMVDAMRVYLAENPDGKALHDPLAACAAIDPTCITWTEVTVTYESGRWGAERREGTGTFISTAIDRARFVETMLRC